MPRNNPLTQILPILQMAKGNPQGFVDMINGNPQFQKFMAENKGKTPQQVAEENGIPWTMIEGFLK